MGRPYENVRICHQIHSEITNILIQNVMTCDKGVAEMQSKLEEYHMI